jgi:tRNA 2-thiocytidine biosynthesis protein TtcA
MFGEIEKDHPHLKETLLSAMGKIDTGRLLDTRFLDLDSANEEAGFFPDEETRHQQLVSLTPVG